MSVDKVASAYAAAYELNDLARVREEYGGEHGLPPGFAEALLTQEKRANWITAAPKAIGGALAQQGKGMAQAGEKAWRAAEGGTLTSAAQHARTLVGTGMRRAGIAIARNPNAVAGGVALGAGALGTGAVLGATR